MNFPRGVNNYSAEGRIKMHDNLKGYSVKLLKYIMENPIQGASVEYNDNRISLYIGQNVKCGITGEISKHFDMEVYHKIPKGKRGTDEYNNLIFIRKQAHKLIHATQEGTIKKYINLMQLRDNQLDKINKLRIMVGNCEL